MENKNSSYFHRFKEWMSGEKDPFIGNVEMQVKMEEPDPELKYKELEKDSIRRNIRSRLTHTWGHHNSTVYRIISVITLFCMLGILIYGVSYLPPVGNPDNPANNEVSARYIEQGLQETGSVNVVTGMILTYRAFDTFGETTVLFIATCCVMIVLMVENKEKRLKLNLDDFGMEPQYDPVLQKVAKVLCPFCLLFGIYVLLNGHHSPGGGFSAGAIIGASLILHTTAFSFSKTEKFFNNHVYTIIKVTALMIYGFIALYFFVTGANGLESIFPLGVPGTILSGGIILPIDFCVGTQVACTIYALYSLFRKGGI